MAAQDLPREVHNREEDITEEHSFDELARGLASGMSRRRVLKLLGGSLVGGLLASLGVGAAAADECKRNGKACKKNSQCCSGNCANGTCAALCVANGGTCTAGTQCCSGICKGGTCAASCIPPETRTCASDAECGGLSAGCICETEASGASVCRDGATGEQCTTSCDCPTGQFCSGGVCFVAC